MTYSTLASIVKYPYTSGHKGKAGKFGFFRSEEESYMRIARELGIRQLPAEEGELSFVRYPLVYLVEAADDICYEIMDIEDAHKLKILTTEETRSLLLAYFPKQQQEHILSRMSSLDDVNEQIVYLRSCVINCLENECVRVFVEHEEEILEGEFEGSLINYISDIPNAAYKACERVSYGKIYHSKDVVDIEIAGYKIISTLMDLMVEAVIHPERQYSKLLLNRVSPQYETHASTLYGKLMAVLDYISGMTDVYALGVYRRINGMKIPNL